MRASLEPQINAKEKEAVKNVEILCDLLTPFVQCVNRYHFVGDKTLS